MQQEQAAAIMAVPGIAIVREYTKLDSYEELAAILIAAALYALALWTLALGLRSQQAGKIPRLPLKVIGSVSGSIATTILAWVQVGPGMDMVQAGIGCLVLSLLAFGVDFRWKPRKAANAQERLNEQLDAVLTHLSDADREATRTGDRELYTTFACYKTAVRKLVNAVRNSPEKAPLARRHLGPLLQGALEAGRNYLRVIEIEPNPKARQMILDMLRKLEREYKLAARDIASGNLASLEIETDVLNDMLRKMH
ncbi:MAG: hypothetical protein CR993_01865 [Rhodobacterales bacterium]|nr:MAG: hypothetical protein CR993_01865 [Rhodobacterales bacterium]